MSVIVTRFKDQTVPVELRDMILEDNKGYVGVAIAHAGNEIQFSKSEIKNTDLIKAQLKTVDEKFKSDVAFFFGKTWPALEEDRQPFTVLRNERDKPILMCMVAGDFSSYAKPDSTHSPEFHMVKEHIFPNLAKTLRILKGDMKAVWEEIKSDGYWEEIKTILSRSDQGCITFISALGEPPLNCNSAGEAEEFDWGFATRIYDYDEEPSEVIEGATAGPEGEDMGLASLLGDTVVTEPKADPATDPKKDEPQKFDPAKIDPAKLPAGFRIGTDKEPTESKRGALLYQAPSTIVSNKDLKLAYMQNAGFRPQNYKHRPEVAVMMNASEAAKKIAMDLSEAQKNVTKDTAPKNILPAAGATKVIPAADTAIASQLSDAPGFIPPDMKQRIYDALSKSESGKKAIDHSGKTISDPSKIQTLEIKAMPATIGIGLKGIEDTLFFDEAAWGIIAKEEKAAKSMMMEMSNWIRQVFPVIAAAKEKSVQTNTAPTDRSKVQRRM